MLDLLCDLVIGSRGTFSNFSYPPYIVEMFLELVGKMIKGHEGFRAHIDDIIQELEEANIRSLVRPAGQSLECHLPFRSDIALPCSNIKTPGRILRTQSSQHPSVTTFRSLTDLRYAGCKRQVGVNFRSAPTGLRSRAAKRPRATQISPLVQSYVNHVACVLLPFIQSSNYLCYLYFSSSSASAALLVGSTGAVVFLRNNI